MAAGPSWVVEMQRMLENTNREEEEARWTQRCIYRVPESMKNVTDSKAYRPWLVSLGPFHHGEPHLLPMEEHKRRAMLHLVKRSGRPLGAFVHAIEEVVDELQGAYEDLDEKWCGANKGRFVEMMVMDGCFLLELMRTDVRGDMRRTDEGRDMMRTDEERAMMRMFVKDDNDLDDYAPNDPVFSLRSFCNLWPHLFKDMMAMENQLPLVVLNTLLIQSAKSPSAKMVNESVLHFLNCEPLKEGMDSLGLHLLHIYHKSYCGTFPPWKAPPDYDYEPRTPCAVELSDAGIQFKKSHTNSIHDVDFKEGMLSMPVFQPGDETDVLHLNLMAFEQLHPGTELYVGSYISFMDKIINSERDVALLRSAGVLVNMTGSDKKVVEIFDTLTKLATAPDRYKLGEVQLKVNAHCRKRRNKWRAIFVNNYLSNPWVFISLVAAVILLIATLLQTFYTIFQFYTKKG